VDTGIAPRTDVQEAQSFYDVTAAGVIDAESQLEDAKRAIAELTSVYPKRLQALREEIPLVEPTPAAPDEWVKSAYDDNFDLSSLQFQLEASRREVSVQRAKRYPTLALQGSVAKSDADQDFGGDQRLDSAGLVISWPLLRGGATQSLIRQAQATSDQLSSQLEANRRSIERQTRNAYRGVVSGIARLKAAKQAAESNHTAMSASQIGVEVGTRTEFDLLNAQNNYYAALQTYHQSRYDYLTNVLTLKQLAGRLSEADLSEIDAMLDPTSDASAPATPEPLTSPFKKTSSKQSRLLAKKHACDLPMPALTEAGRNSLRLRMKITKPAGWA
jgi:outer membrane protein